MPNIALRPCHITEKRKVTLELEYDLAEQLKRYQMFYEHQHGGMLSEAKLIAAILRQFITDDRAFQRFKGSTKVKRRASAKPESIANEPSTVTRHSLESPRVPDDPKGQKR